MPAFPKIRKGSGEIGAIKIGRQIKAQEFGCSDSNVRISRKIQIELKSKKEDSYP